MENEHTACLNGVGSADGAAADPASLAQPDFQRRGFVKTGVVGMAGVLGAGTLLAGTASTRAAEPRKKPATAAGAAPGGPTDFPRPNGLLPGATLDSRFPVSFQPTVTEGFRLVTEYFTALNQRDVAAIAKTLHFPFAIYEEIEPLVFETEADFVRSPPPSLNTTGRGLSKINAGSYDILESMNVHLYCPVGGVFSLTFTRYTKAGEKLLECDGVYSVTNNDGRWGIQLVSTIIHERGFEKYPYPDAEMAERLQSQGYLSAFGYHDEALLNDRTKGRGSFEPRLPVGTKTASVNFGYGPRERTKDARNNEPMRGWKTKGVKSRLMVSTVSENAGEQNTNLAEFIDLAGETVGPYAYTRINPVRPLTVHATHDKAHMLGGYWRYTADSVLISETRGFSIRIWKAGSWGSAGQLGQVTHHDRSNSKA
jgi:hypothetical protein